MRHHVYANDDESDSARAGRAADRKIGSSAGAAPDVCMSPPGPPAGPVPIPYSNTCEYKDLTDLSITVFLKGSGAALENKSAFKTSYGNEPATENFSKGLVSAKIKGRCYFQSWSPNVKIEGLGVARHMDMVTHNHSNPTNTPSAPYVSVDSGKSKCRKNKNKMNHACKPESRKEKGKKAAKASGFSKITQKLDALVDKNVQGWVADHCGGLMLKPVSPKTNKDISEISKKMLEMTEDLDRFVTNELSRVGDEIKDAIFRKSVTAAEKMALKKARNAAIRHGVALGGGAIGGVGAVVTEAAAAVVTAGDTIHGIYKGGAIAWEAVSKYGSVSDIIDEIPAKLRDSINEAKNNPQKALSDFNQCISLNPDF